MNPLRSIFTILLVAVLATTAQAAPSSSLANVSTRARVGSGDDTFISGFVLKEEARVLVRAVGPSLAQFSVRDVLTDPRLVIYDAKGVRVAEGIPVSELNFIQHEAFITIYDRAGAFPIIGPTNDAVLFAPLPAGAYTVHVTSRSGRSGVVLGEVYSLKDAAGFQPIKR
jgi:hypothetical protein